MFFLFFFFSSFSRLWLIIIFVFLWVMQHITHFCLKKIHFLSHESHHITTKRQKWLEVGLPGKHYFWILPTQYQNQYILVHIASVSNENLKQNVQAHYVYQRTVYIYTLFLRLKCTKCTSATNDYLHKKSFIKTRSLFYFLLMNTWRFKIQNVSSPLSNILLDKMHFTIIILNK